MFLTNIQLVSFIPGRYKHENYIIKSKIVVKQNPCIDSNFVLYKLNQITMKNLLLFIAMICTCTINSWATHTDPTDPKKDAKKEHKKDIALETSKTTGLAIRYHYYPNMRVYYDLSENIYHFWQDGQWITAEELPAAYGGYSLFKNEKIQIIDYDGDNPETMITIHSKKFPYNAKGRIQRPEENMLGNNTVK